MLSVSEKKFLFFTNLKIEKFQGSYLITIANNFTIYFSKLRSSWKKNSDEKKNKFKLKKS
ncbi:hypothetical protein BpHYR1_037059 [Brachionus plicatilis]|uniref:Uncharacterized protein n=1 Tax=Brachionus plicatilis TaxID=10195 RepID=A0A3M7PKH8_BRAPC|nr:hypothetical protein BpHYR1_037059 [Brachionus plicatilis]